MADEKLREMVKKAENNIAVLFDSPEKMQQYLELVNKNEQLTYYAASMFEDSNTYIDTYNGWQERGFQVKSGQHGTPVFQKRKQIKRKFIDETGKIRDLATASFIERQKIQNGDLKLSSDLSSYYIVEHLFTQEQTTASGVSLDNDIPKSILSFGHIQSVLEESADIVMDGDDFVVPNTVMECAIAYSTYMLCLAENVDYDKNELYKLAVSNITDSQATLTLSEKKLVLNYAIKMVRSECTKELLENRRQEVSEYIENMKSQGQEKVVSNDITDLRIIDRDFDNGTKEETYTFECNMKGEPTILTYSVVNEKYGASFSIHTDKNDIWDKIQNKKMEAGEIDKLVKRLSDEAAFYNWNKKITEALNTDELLDIKYEFLEAENLSKSASQRIGDALDNREKEFAQSQTEKSFQFTDEPESKKSTKNKIEDFGKKIGGAKKDLWKDRGLTSTDLINMNFAEKNKYATKNFVFPKPDYQKMVDEGMPVRVAFFIKTIRDALPAKPTIDYFEKDNDELIAKKLEGYVEFISDFKDTLMKVKTEDDILSFYKNEIKDVYVAQTSSYYVEPTEKCHGNLTNKLLKACQINRYTLLDYDRKIKKKQFCYSDHDKKVDGFEIIKFDDSCEFDNDRDRTILKRQVGGSTYFYYPDNEFVDASKWQKDTYYVLYKRTIVANNLTKGQAEDVVERMGDKVLALKAEAKEGEKKARKKKFVPEQLEHIERTGPSNGIDENHPADGQMYLDTFGFAGGEFGNWMNEKDRQASLNFGYDAFMDLADALEIEPEDISLGGELSIAFGSRGSAGAVAHYEPLRQVINLTKMHGAGSLAHEWGHALDNILSKKVKGSGVDTWLTDTKSNFPSAMPELVDAMLYRTATDQEKIERREVFADLHRGILETEFDTFMPEKDFGTNFYNEHLNEITDLCKKSNLTDKEINSFIISLSEQYEQTTGKELSENISGEITKFLKDVHHRYNIPLDKIQMPLQKTEFYTNSVKMDSIYSKDSHGYWQSKKEMFARAFACYVKDKLDYKSDYLCGHADTAVSLYEGEVIKAMPVGAERQLINEKFDKLIGQLKEMGLLHEQSRTQIKRKSR